MAPSSAKLVVLRGPMEGQIIELTQVLTVIGREPGLDMVFSVPGVSRRHAQLRKEGEQYVVEDLGSSNGTSVNNEKITSPRLLKSGDVIGFGRSAAVRFEISVPAATILESPQVPNRDFAPTRVDEPLPDSFPQQSAQLIVSEYGGMAKSYELDKQEITIGRNPGNDVTLSSPIVSRLHARILRSGNEYRIEPARSSSNPIYFRDQPLSGTKALKDGDLLHIGRPGSDSRISIRFSQPAQGDPTGVDTELQPVASPAVMMPVGPDVGTMLAADIEMPEIAVSPQFKVAVAGNRPRTYSLTSDRLTIGRAPDNDIIVDSKIVSRYHATIERTRDGYQIVPLPDAGNPVLYEGRPLNFSRRLHHEDILRIGGLDPGSLVTMTYVSPSEASGVSGAQSVEFGDQTVITVGRDSSNDVVLDTPLISRFHAQVERVGQRYRVRDLRSSNGTFVNDQRIEGDVWLKPEDNIRVGPYRFVMGQDQLSQFDESSGLRVDAIGLNKWVRKDLNILQDISLVFKPREFIVVVGQSGGGKSTLVDAIAGYRPATHGSVFVNDTDVYRHFDAIRNDIGFVPQRDIIHMELSVFQALDYAAQLRMPPDTTKAERHQRIEEVLDDLDLSHRRDVQISGLSGGQQKRVSIGVELLTKPGLFFLDEPTSGLDPGTETALMQLMRRLADQGRTIVLVTHATKNVMLADKVVFLARGGYLAWFGPPDEALAYFDQYRSERDRRARDIEFDEIYAVLDNPTSGLPSDWAERYKQHPAHQQYIVQALQEKQQTSQLQGLKPAAAPKIQRRRQVSSVRQLMILSARNAKILTRDRFSLGLMLAAAPLVSLLDVILSVVLGKNPFDFDKGFMANVLITLFLLTVYGVMVGGLAQMREIVKEQDVYKRERLVNLRIIPYVMSKIWFAIALSLYIAAVYVFVHYLVFEMPGGFIGLIIIYISLAMATMAGMMLGLFASALAPNANSAPLIVILLMLPQIVLGGALVPLPQIISAPTSTRWAFQAFMAATNTGSDVAADACWLLPASEIELLTLEEKDANCRCMGANAVRKDSCDFPGSGAFYDEAIDQPPPESPGEPPSQPNRPSQPPGDPPPEPELPPRPPRPEDNTDFVALAEFEQQLTVWEAEVQEINNGYRAQLQAYQSEVDVFRAEMEAFNAQLTAFNQEMTRYERNVAEFQEAQAEYATRRLGAITAAEQVIGQTNRDFGWLFVNRDDTASFWGTIALTWIAQSAIIGLLFLAILILIKRKDVS